MRVGFFLSNKGGSPLEVGLRRGLAHLGHCVEDVHRGTGYDLILVFNQCAHTTDYAYPEFPKGSTPMAFVDTAEYGYFKRLSDVIENFKTAFSEGSKNHDTKNHHQQTRLQQFMEGKSFPYFLREHFKQVTFPACYYPIDYPLYLHSECRDRPNREEYLRRKLDLFVSWGASHPWRINITKALRECPARSEISIIEENGHVRIHQPTYLQKTRSAKCSVSFDGYGSGSFRVTEVVVRCLLLIGPMSIRLREPLIDGVHCVQYDVTSNGRDFISTNIKDKLKEALDDQERSFRIHEAGYNHCMEHYTETATARYVLATVASHDWSKPTPLTF